MFQPAYQLPPNYRSELVSVVGYLADLRADAVDPDPEVRARAWGSLPFFEQRRVELLRALGMGECDR